MGQISMEKPALPGSVLSGNQQPVIGNKQHDLYRILTGGAVASADEAGRLAADAMAEFVANLPLPQRLRDIGMTQSDVEAIVNHVEHEFMMNNAPRSLLRREILDVILAAW